MTQSGRNISFKILQLIVCIGAIIFKKITDNKAHMISKINQKTSNEWNLLQNVTWSAEGNDFSIFAYAGYTFIIAVCLLDRMINFKKASTTTDTLFLRFGVIIFFIQGIMVFYSVEYVPEDIRINAYILGSLSFLVGILFFLEDCLTIKGYETSNKIIQTEKLKPISSIPLKLTEDNILHTYV
ncbi:uncharacterized protein LOC119600678 [Lucilia sericata]|uniref:uncharacterized protein LOC119600678 n=1 Tax=Lucilia sericata TaxID=13632 RepID=UPI0018A81834|nr:uncharacterized protein LOC119600678 [Lucilia sericata]